MKNIKQIRSAVEANRGGLTNVTDSQIMRLWRSLDEATQQKYLDSVKQKGVKNWGANHETK